jgi:biofilm PGA synthesis N-glycosyltransferase PgaC
MNNIIKYINYFVFWYPCIMSIIMITGGLIFYNTRRQSKPIKINSPPFVSVLIPCYCEGQTIINTIEKLNQLNYPCYEIIAINDGSKDNTSKILKELTNTYDKLRVIDLKENCGKANALHLGLLASKGEYLMCIDADAYLDKEALNYMIPHFLKNGERVGAITGNPRILNKSNLLSKIQTCEFSSIVGLSRRSQRILGKIMTVSGVVVCFRKKALLDCGLWDRDMITEDISVSWKLQKRFWDIRYEPNAICWMLVPITLKGLFNQRLRWSQGGLETILRNKNIFKDIRQRRIYPIFVEQVLSITWAFSWFFLLINSIINAITYKDISHLTLISKDGLFLALICLIQFFCNCNNGR